MNRIITIGREFGSGGREMGRRLAEELGIAYYDQEILEEIAKRTDLSEKYIHGMVEKRPSFSFPIHVGHSFRCMQNGQWELNLAVFREQSAIITDMANTSDCVIVGRCADYILAQMHPMRIFVHADMDSRLRRCRRKAAGDEKLSDKELAANIRRIDKNRSKYYEFYTGKTWGDKRLYDLCINTTRIEIKDAAASVAKMLR